MDNEKYIGIDASLREFEDIEQSNLEDNNQDLNEDFEETLTDIDFSEMRGDFKKSFKKVNHKLAIKKSTKKHVSKKPLTKEFFVKSKAFVESPNDKKLAKVLVPRDRKVIVEGVNKFILNGDSKDDSIKNIGYYKGEKLNELVLTFNNNSALPFNLELFNPSMPMDYLQSTSLNLNDKIQVAGGEISYSDVLFNLLANPSLVVNAKFVFASPTPTQTQQQIAQSLQVKNKQITGVEKIHPLSVQLKIDNLQVASDIVYFDLSKSLNRPFIPDGMDVIGYTVQPAVSVTMCFYYKQISLKKVFFNEARNSKKLL